MYPSETADKFMLRLPEKMRNTIKETAARNHRSMNSEIIFHLEKVFGGQETGAASANSSPVSVSNNAALQGGASINAEEGFPR